MTALIFELAFLAALHVGFFAVLWLYTDVLVAKLIPKSAVRVISGNTVVLTMLAVATICVEGFVAYIIYEHFHTPRSGDSGHSFTVPFIVYILIVFLVFDVLPTVLCIRRDLPAQRIASAALNTVILMGTTLGIASLYW